MRIEDLPTAEQHKFVLTGWSNRILLALVCLLGFFLGYVAGWTGGQGFISGILGVL